SLSKTFCMTGWRLAWAAGRPELIAALGRVKNYVDTGAFLAVQAAGAAVLPQAEALAQGYGARFRERRDAMLPALRAQGFEPETAEATMYVWVPLPEGVASAAFARRALTDVWVVTLAGSGFGGGGEGFFRIALTFGTPRLVEAAERLGKVLAAVRDPETPARVSAAHLGRQRRGARGDHRAGVQRVVADRPAAGADHDHSACTAAAARAAAVRRHATRGGAERRAGTSGAERRGARPDAAGPGRGRQDGNPAGERTAGGVTSLRVWTQYVQQSPLGC